MPRQDNPRRERDDDVYGAYYRRGTREGAYGYGDDRYERQAGERDESRRSMGFMGDRERDRRGAYEREDPGRGPHAWYGDASRYDEQRGRGEQYYGRGGEYGGIGQRYGGGGRYAESYDDAARRASWYERGGDEAGYRSRAADSRRYTTGYPYGASRADEPIDRYDAYGRHVSGYRSTVRGGGEGTQTGGYSGTQDKYGTGGEYAGGRPQESHRGRGPKNYTRSDERIREDLCERLAEDHAIDASDITVEVKNGVVTLSGTVTARHLKHRAEDIADHCGGVKDVENHLGIKLPGDAAARHKEAGKEGIIKKH